MLLDQIKLLVTSSGYARPKGNRMFTEVGFVYTVSDYLLYIASPLLA